MEAKKPEKEILLPNATNPNFAFERSLQFRRLQRARELALPLRQFFRVPVDFSPLGALLMKLSSSDGRLVARGG